MHALHESAVRRAVADAVRRARDIRTVQELLGHKSVNTAMLYTHAEPRRAGCAESAGPT
ncbi:MAG: tyrosine-type recombinase/integrase [Gemmatimonadota bacterium]